MTLKSTISTTRRMVLTISEGSIAGGELMLHQKLLARSAEFNKEFVQLWDGREGVAAYSPTTVANMPFIFSTQTRRAILVTTTLSYGMGRQLQMRREDEHQGALGLFNQLDEALQWIERTMEDYESLLRADDWIIANKPDPSPN